MALYLMPFYVVDPDLAAKETRVIHVLQPQRGIPLGSYGLLEFYCPDPACDCRRVMLNVAGEREPERFLAAISYGFDQDDPEAGRILIRSMSKVRMPPRSWIWSTRQCFRMSTTWPGWSVIIG